MMTDKIYNVLKWTALIAIPAVGTFVGVVLPLWGVCSGETVTAITTTISAVGTLIGALIGVSTSQYNKMKKEENNNE